MDNQSMNNNTTETNNQANMNNQANFNTQPNLNGQPYPNVVPVQVTDNSSKATPALICGIISIVASFLIPLAGIILGIIGITMGKKAKQSAKASMGKAGFICGIIGVSLSVILWVVSIIFSVALLANL